MESGGNHLSSQAAHAIEVLGVIQTTKSLLARFLRLDVLEIDKILNEIKSQGLPLMSKKAEDNEYYYWLEK